MRKRTTALMLGGVLATSMSGGVASALSPMTPVAQPGYTCTGVVTFVNMQQMACIQHQSGHPVNSFDQYQALYPAACGGTDTYSGITTFNQIRYGSTSSVPVKQATNPDDATYDINHCAIYTLPAAWPYKAGAWFDTAFTRWTDFDNPSGDHGAGGTDPSHVATVGATF